MRIQKSWGLLPAFLLTFLLSACGGGGGAGFSGDGNGNGGTPTPTPVTATPAFVFLNTSSSQLANDADLVSEGVTVSAVVTDASGVVIPGVAVGFAIAPGTGALAPSGTVTDSTGTLSAVLTTGGNAALRTVTVTATVSNLPAQSVSIQVVNAGTPPSTATPSNLQLVASATRLPTDADTAAEGSVLTAFVTTATGTVVSGSSVSFAIINGPGLRSGALQITRSSTDDSGTAQAILTTGGNSTPGTIRVQASISTPGGTLIQTLDVQVAAAAGSVELFGSSNQLLSNASTVGAGVTLTAVVRNAQGQPVAGANVVFAASSGQINGGTTPTDAQGRATAVLTTGGNPSPRSITVTATATGAASSPLTIQVVNAVNSIELLSSSNQLASTASTPSQGVGLTAIVRDAQGNLLPGVTVSFNGGTGGISATRLVTDDSGTATATLTTGGNATVRTIAVTASASGVTSNSVSVNVVTGATTPSGNVTTVQLIGSSNVLPADRSQTVSFTALALNADGNVVPNVPVAFRLLAPNGDGALQVTRGTTDSSGTATASLALGANINARTIAVRAEVDTGAGIVPSPVFNVSVVAAANGIELFSSSSRLVGGQTIAISAAVRNATGQPLSNAVVSFRADSGVLSAGTATTNASGIATVNLTNGGNSTPRTITLTASAPGSTSGPLAVQVVSAVNSIELLTSGTQLASDADTAAEGVKLTAIVRDADGNLVPGVRVAFAATSGQVIATQLVTGATGVATGTLTTGGSATLRAIQVTASGEGVASSAVTVDVVANVTPGSRVVTRVSISGSTNELRGGSADSASLVALAQNAAGAVIGDATIRYRLVAPNDDGLLFDSGNGTATVSADAAPVPRTINVVAEVDTGSGIVSSPVFPIAVVRAGSGIELFSSSPRLVAGGAAVTISAIVRDADSQPVSGSTVRFAANSGVLSAATAVTNASGLATVTLSDGGNRTTRTISITATAPGATASPLQVTVVSPVASIELQPVLGPSVGFRNGAYEIRSDADTAAEGAGFIATLRDANGSVLGGVPVTFSAPTGGIAPTALVSDPASGVASATLTTGGNTARRTIAVSASADGITSNVILVDVVGAVFATSRTVTEIRLAASSTQLASNGSQSPPANPVSLTALVLNAEGLVVPDVLVEFALVAPNNNGALSPNPSLPGGTPPAPVQQRTSDFGLAQAFLFDAFDPSPRSITVRAMVNNGTTILTQDITIQVIPASSGIELFSSFSRLLPTGGGTTLSAVVRDANGAAQPGVVVTFTADSGALSARTATTNGAGLASVTLTAAGNPTPRTITIRATAPGVSSSPLSVQVVAPVARVQLDGPTQILSTASSPLPGNTLTATATDADGNVIGGARVSFAVVSGQVINSGLVTDPTTGQATGILTTGGNAALRTISVTASSEGVTSDPLSVQVVTTLDPASQVVTSLDLSGTAATIPAVSGATTNLVATARNANGAVVSGVPVTFRLVAPNTDGSVQVTRGTTDASGSATAVLGLDSSLTARTIDVQALVDTGSAIVPSQVFSVNVVAAAAGIELFSPTSRLVNGQTVPVNAVVRDASGAPLAGVTVIFQTTSGNLSAGTAVTNGSGLATVNLNNGGNTAPRTITVTASAPGASSAPLAINVVNAVDTIELLSAGLELASDADTATEGLALTALVRDADGNVLPGVRVSFTAVTGGVAATGLVTNAAGTATGRLTTGGDATLRTISVTATAAGVTSNAVLVNVVPTVAVPSRAVTQVRLLANTGVLFSDGDTAAEGVTLTAIVTNANDNVVSGVPVQFSLVSPNNSGVLQPGQGVTDASGTVSTVLTTGGNAVARSIVVQATVDTGSGLITQTFTVQVVNRVTTLVLLTSSATLPSGTLDDGSPFVPGVASDTRVLVTALARDVNNQVVANEPVSFSSDSGSLRVTGATTDASGQATALLSTGGDPQNRTITVTATIGTTVQVITVDVRGTVLLLSGSPSIGLGDTQAYTVRLTDSAGQGIRGRSITLTSANGNTLSPPTATTGPDGTASFNFTGTVGGADVLTASVFGLTSNLSVSVSNFALSISQPLTGTSVSIAGGTSTVQVQLTGPAVAGQTLSFASSRGSITATAVTDGAGVATATFTADRNSGAGPVIITVVGPEQVSAFVVINAVAPAPDAQNIVTVQASPATIPPSGTSTIRAIVRDASDNLVANERVTFSLVDNSSGSLSTASGFTNALGILEINYTASAVASGQQRVVITGTLPNGNVDTAALTVAQPAVFVTLGTDNKVIKNDAAQTYDKSFAILFRDSAGNPAPATTTYRIQVRPLAFQKGRYFFDVINSIWFPVNSATGTAARLTTVGGFYTGCANEDVDRDGILDAGEDYNANTVLDPGGIAVVPSQTQIDASGFATFLLRYPQEYGHWVAVELSVIATVQGTESTTTRVVELPVAADDLTDQNVAPPGVISPFGTNSVCESNVTARAGVDQTVGSGDVVTLDGSGSNVGGAAVASYQWTEITSSGVVLSDPTAQAPTFTAPIGATRLVFQLTVTDGRGFSESDTVTVNVQ